MTQTSTISVELQEHNCLLEQLNAAAIHHKATHNPYEHHFAWDLERIHKTLYEGDSWVELSNDDWYTVHQALVNRVVVFAKELQHIGPFVSPTTANNIRKNLATLETLKYKVITENNPLETKQ